MLFLRGCRLGAAKQTLNNPYWRHGLRAGPLAFRRLVGLIPEADYDRKTSPERFTLREAAAHLADWEPILRERIRLAVVSPGSSVEAYDESERAVQQNYQATHPVEEAERWQQERDETVAYLDTLRPEDFAKTCVHPERGTMTVEDMVALLIGHDAYHIVHVTEYLNP